LAGIHADWSKLALEKLLNMGESIELSSISWYYWLGIVFAS
jgi:hypothetical protein